MKRKYTLKEINKILSDDNKNNYTCDYEDDYSLLESLDDYFIHDLIGICGCGKPDWMRFLIRDVLKLYEWEHDTDNIVRRSEEFREERKRKYEKVFGVKNIYDSPMALFVVYILNDKELLEHGTGIGGSWITELGRMCLTVLEEKCREIENELEDK